MDDTISKQHDKPRGEASLSRKVGRMGMLIHRYYEAQGRRHGGLGDPLRGQGRILALLRAKPQTTQRELSYLLDMRQQSLSELLAKLEEKGFVTREKSDEDGRVTVVRLTEAGAAAAPSPDQMQARTDALDCLDEEERAQLETLADKVTASLEQKLTAMGIDPSSRPHGPHGPGRGPHGHRGPGRDGQDDHRMRRGPHRPHGTDDEGDHGGHGRRRQA